MVHTASWEQQCRRSRYALSRSTQVSYSASATSVLTLGILTLYGPAVVHRATSPETGRQLGRQLHRQASQLSTACACMLFDRVLAVQPLTAADLAISSVTMLFPCRSCVAQAQPNKKGPVTTVKVYCAKCQEYLYKYRKAGLMLLSFLNICHKTLSNIGGCCV